MNTCARNLFGAFTIALGLATAGNNGTAQTRSDAVISDRVHAELVTPVEQAVPGDTLTVALRFDIAPSWHTYWRNPGDSGAETTISWEVPGSVVTGPVQWPAPERLPYGPLMNYGYSNEVWHLVDVTVPETWTVGTPISLFADARWLVCADICIPEEGTFSIAIPTGPEHISDPVTTEMVESWRQRIPSAAPFSAEIIDLGDRLTLVANASVDAGSVTDAYFFPGGYGIVEHPAPQDWRVTDSGVELSLAPGQSAPGAQVEGVLVLTQAIGPRTFVEAYTLNAPVVASIAAPMTTPAAVPLSLWVAALFAFIGGIILNLMPCVFPVLSIKALALVSKERRSVAELAPHGFAYAAGVLATFLVIALLLYGLRFAGAEIGWGFQLQSPVFIAALAYLFFAIGLNLSGVFDINLTPNAGGELAGSGGLRGAFFTGALAVIVATPCTAPFMAAALGAALTMPVAAMLVVFFMLGVGFALPFLLFTLIPALARRLPRPGPWMERLKQGLAFPMYASAAWLVWVLALQVGADAVLTVLIGGVLLAFGLWLALPRAVVAGRVSRVAGVASAAVALALLTVPATASKTKSGVAAQHGEPFDTTRLDAILEAGEPAFVHMTAAWCITCQVNERVALTGDAFETALADGGIHYLIGDWTNEDPAITRYLERYGRSGVPLYVVYPAGGGDPAILPQILTPGTVAEALAKASAG